MTVTTATATPPRPARTGRPTRTRTLLALARVEGVRLARHPAALTGLALSCFLLVVFQDVTAMVLHRDVALVQLAAAPFAGGTLVAAQLAASRAARHGTGELFQTMRTSAGERLGGVLLGGLAPAAISGVWALAAVAYLRLQGAIWWPEPADLLAVPAWCLLAALVGAGVGAAAATAVAGPLAVIGFGMVEIGLMTRGGTLQRLSFLADWGPGFGGAPEVWPRLPWVHLAWVLGVAGVVGALAISRHGRRWAGLAAGAVSLVVAVLAGGALLRLPSEMEVRRLVASVVQPERLATVCEPAGPATVCTPPAYAAWIDRWRPVVAEVTALVPPQAVPEDLRVEVAAPPGDTPPSVRAAIAQRYGHDGGVASPRGTVRLGTRFYGAGPNAVAALGVARELVDLGGIVPVEPPPDARPATRLPTGGGQPALRRRCSAEGQAREVVALWVAATASPELETWLRGSIGTGINYLDLRQLGERDVSFNLDLWIEDGYDDPRTEVAWSREGAFLAVQLLDQPDQDEIREGVASRWEHWTVPGTAAADLVAAFGLDGLPDAGAVLDAAGIEGPARQLGSDLLTGDGPSWGDACP